MGDDCVHVVGGWIYFIGFRTFSVPFLLLAGWRLIGGSREDLRRSWVLMEMRGVVGGDGFPVSVGLMRGYN